MLRNNRFHLALTALLAAGLWLVGAPSPANAGCGCDHPPPAWAPVMPPFAAPGKTILIHHKGEPFTPGVEYQVQFGSPTKKVSVIADSPNYLEAVVPKGTKAGPVKLMIGGPSGPGQYLLSYPSSEGAFAALPPAPVLPAVPGEYKERRLKATVTEDGTLLLPVNMRHVKDATQVAFQLLDFPLEFNAEDVVIYNMDGVDLTLFTLAVDGETEMEWGSYYGWQVEDDTGLFGVVYDTKVTRSSEPSKRSDVLTYWRHEFETYDQAHQPGGTHELNANGSHPDGSLHINHGHLVLAISGMKRSANNPDDPASHQPLSPGSITVDVGMVAQAAANPIEPDVMTDLMESTQQFGSFDPAEDHFDEFEGGQD
jgi:hypothetical protein